MGEGKSSIERYLKIVLRNSLLKIKFLLKRVGGKYYLILGY